MRNSILKELQTYFDIREIVCPHTYNTFKEKAWQFFNTELLYTLLIIRRDILNRPMIINTWHTNGGYSQRGLRCNICEISKMKTQNNQIYLSSHCNGAGIDFTCKDISAEQARKTLEQKAILLPYPVRMEKDVTWVHIDVYNAMNNKKITYFK